LCYSKALLSPRLKDAFSMQLSLSWLNHFVDLQGLSPDTVANALTQLGLEVEGTPETQGPAFFNVVVGHVQAIAPHPNADKLRLVTVALGDATPTHQVVCGAPNVAQGQFIAFALNGATVFSKKTNAWFTLTPATIRGVDSQGMVCSLEELGLEASYPAPAEGGIWPLNTQFDEATCQQHLGQPLEQLLGLEKDVILHTAPTANRGDWMSYRGIARDLAAALQRPLLSLATELPPALPTSHPLPSGEGRVRDDQKKFIVGRPSPATPAATSPEGRGNDALLVQEELMHKLPFSVDLPAESLSHCTYYSVALVKDVTVAPSPAWVRQRLEASGIRSINNVVDITNLVLLECGQPLHTFDADKLGGSGVLSARLAHPDETLATLDDVTRTLAPPAVVITHNNKPVALAGVMGGADEAIDDGTTTVLLEAAHFPTASTRRSARSQGLRSESSARFERGVDVAATPHALARAVQLLAELAGGQLVGATASPLPAYQPTDLTLSLAWVAERAGLAIDDTTLINTLTPLGFGVQPTANPDQFSITVPSHRADDVSQPADLLEELLRLVGYATVPATLPQASAVAVPSPRRRLLGLLHRTLQGLGFNEWQTSSLVGPQLNQRFGHVPVEQQVVGLSNSASALHTQLRQALWPNLLEVVASNVANDAQLSHCWGYELGRTYWHRGKASHKQTGVQEQLTLGLLSLGQPALGAWRTPAPHDFYTAKGQVESLLQRLGLLHSVQWVAASPEAFGATPLLATAEAWHPGQTALLFWQSDTPAKAKPLGFLATLHPTQQANCKLPAPAFVAELSVDALLKPLLAKLKTANVTLTQRSQYPAMQRDMALQVPASLSYETLRQALLQAENQAESLVQALTLFDVYEGAPLPQGFRSLAFRVTLQSPHSTLTDEQADATMATLRQRATALPEVSLR
jgi:phenylalanyl-tRNA synthetase beta chain